MRSETATLGGGCFWCLEAVYDELRGVTDVVSGYSGGGRKMIASYEDKGAADYTEAPFRVYGLGLEHKHVDEIQDALRTGKLGLRQHLADAVAEHFSEGHRLLGHHVDDGFEDQLVDLRSRLRLPPQVAERQAVAANHPGHKPGRQSTRAQFRLVRLRYASVR